MYSVKRQLGFGIPEAIVSMVILAIAMVGIQKAFLQSKGISKTQSLGILQLSLESDIRAALEDPSMIRKLPSGNYQLLRGNPSVVGGREVIADTTNNTIVYFDDDGEKCVGSISKCPFGVQIALESPTKAVLVYRIGQNLTYTLKEAAFASLGVPGKLETDPNFKFSADPLTGDFKKFGFRVPDFGTVGGAPCKIEEGEWMKGKGLKDNKPDQVLCWKLIKIGEVHPITGEQSLCPGGTYPKGLIYEPRTLAGDDKILTPDFLSQFSTAVQEDLQKSNAVIPQCEEASPTVCPDGYSLVGVSSLEFFKAVDDSFPSVNRSKCVFTYADTFKPATSGAPADRCPTLTVPAGVDVKGMPYPEKKIAYVFDIAANICRIPAGIPKIVDSKVLELEEEENEDDQGET